MAHDRLAFGVDKTREGDCDVLAFSGEIDVASADEFRQTIVDCEPGRNVIVDLARVSFMDSAGSRALVSASTARRREGSDVHIASAPGDRVRRTLDLLRIDQAVPMHDSHDKAVDASDC